MIDTVRLSLARRLHSQSEMESLRFIPVYSGKNGRYRNSPVWVLNPANSSHMPRLSWTTAPTGVDYLLTEVSLPKMMFGNNINELGGDQEIEAGLNAISRFVADASELDYDAFQANVSRVDYCHSWRLTPTKVCEYLQALSNGSLPRMKRLAYDDSTIQFSNKSQTAEFYDKHLETISRLRTGRATDAEIVASLGVLRFENRYLDYRACDRLAVKCGLPNRRAEGLLRARVAQSVMNEKLTHLGIDEAFGASDVRFVKLLSHYGPKRAFPLMGFLIAGDTFGQENLVRLKLCNQATFYRYCRDVRLAGAALVSPKGHSLAPLRLVKANSQLQDRAAV